MVYKWNIPSIDRWFGGSPSSQIPPYGGFHGHGCSPIAGWSIRENPTRKWMITRGTPILGNLHLGLKMTFQWFCNVVHLYTEVVNHPLESPFHSNGIVPYKPSSYWGTPMAMESSISFSDLLEANGAFPGRPRQPSLQWPCASQQCPDPQGSCKRRWCLDMIDWWIWWYIIVMFVDDFDLDL